MSTLVTILLAIVMQLLGNHQAANKTAINAQKHEISITKGCDSIFHTTKDTAVYLHHHPSKNEQQLNENNAL